MAITPETNLYLLKCPLEIDNKNQITFTNELEQRNYFLSLPYLENDHFSYQRKDSVIRYPAHIDTIIEYNYCMYQNSNYTNKWFYAYITGMQYLNDNCTLISIATDVFQTWQFNLDYKESFIEREHINVNEDTIGANLLPEGLEIGEVIENASTSIDGLNHVYVIACSKFDTSKNCFSNRTNSTVIYNGCILNNIASGLWYYISSADQCLSMIKQLDDEGLGESVITVFTVPAVSLLGLGHGVTDVQLQNINSSFGIWINGLFNSNGREFTLAGVPTSLDGYTPRNQKLRQYPYCYLGFTPSNGSPKIFRYEDFKNAVPSFKILSEINPNPQVTFIPKDYKGITGVNVSENSSASGYPAISYHTDHYSNWIAQNQNLINLNLERGEYNFQRNFGDDFKGALGSTVNNNPSKYIQNQVKNILTANIGGIIGQATEREIASKNHEYDIQNQMLVKEQHQLLPNSGSTGGSNATLLGYGLQNQDIFTKYTIKRQYAERIDKYFDMYGYLTNKVKVPNITGRPTWNYVKTIGAIIEGNIPQVDLDQIKELFNNGITLWHSTQNFLNYSANNR